AHASVVVLNTCTVTAAADAQARDSIRRIHAQNPNARIIVTGCYAQRAPEELSTLPGVNHVVGNSHKPQIPNLVESLSTHSAAASLVGPQHAAPHLGTQQSATPNSSSSAFFPAATLSQDDASPFRSSPQIPFDSVAGVRQVYPELGSAVPGLGTPPTPP